MEQLGAAPSLDDETPSPTVPPVRKVSLNQ